MDPSHVVTVFLRNGADVLLLQRSGAGTADAGRWGGVAGFVEGDPDASARRAVREETGIDPDALSLVRRGEPFTADDAEAERVRRVYPYLFDCPTREAETDPGAAGFAWMPPTELLRRETVPDGWRAYDAVRPTVETVRADRERGSASLSVRALEVLRDEAAVAGAGPGEGDDPDRTDLASIARDLRDARDGMAALSNRVNRAMHEGGPTGTPGAVEAAAEAGIDRALRADDDAAARAADLVAGERVLTLSRSGTVRDALVAGDPDGVVVAESRPGGEGVPVAEGLADAGLDVTLTADSAVAWLLGEREVDLLLVGADALLPDGTLVNKVGTRGAALAATREGIPALAVCATDKVRPDPPDDLAALLERADRAAVYDGSAAIEFECPLFDATPADMLSGVVTEDGILDADGVGEVADELRSVADWDG